MGVGKRFLGDGVGKWAMRIYPKLAKYGIKPKYLVDVKDYQEIRDVAELFNIKEENYHQIFPGEDFPEEVLNSIDFAHISSPNEFHKEKILQALNAGKRVVVEKLIACNRKDFGEIIEQVWDNDWEGKIILNVHYPFKPYARTIETLLEDYVEEYGKITKVEATFYEEYTKEDESRDWLFNPENSGIQGDWLPHVTGMFVKYADARLSFNNEKPKIDSDIRISKYPTKISAGFKIWGNLFDEDAVANISVGKGLNKTKKQLKFWFKNYDKPLLRDFAGQNTMAGLTSYSKMAKQIDSIMKGGPLFYSIGDMMHMYKPIFQLNEYMEKHKMYEPKKKLEEIAAQ